MQTIVVNTFGGPGTGKTTACWEIASELKKNGIITEYVSEYAKELVYEEKWDILDDTMKNQKKILKEQKRRLDRLIGKVQVIVTDSPLLLSIIYANDANNRFKQDIINKFNEYSNLNFFIVRNKRQEFQQNGRKQNLEESKEKDKEILNLLKDNEIVFQTYYHKDIKDVVNTIIARVK
jgi:hypothetical protein